MAGEGGFAFVESSVPNYPNVEFELWNDLGLTEDDNPAAAKGLDSCTFWYHMHGNFIGTLQFDTSADGGTSWSTAWTKTGAQVMLVTDGWLVGMVIMMVIVVWFGLIGWQSKILFFMLELPS